MARKKSRSRRSPGDLPQRPETWLVAIHQLRIWITPEDEDPWRPFTTVIFNLDKDMLHTMEATQDSPTSKQVLEMLFQAMQKPPRSARQKPHRPEQVIFEDAALAEALSPELEKLGIAAQRHPRFEEMEDLLAEMEDHMRGGPEPPGLLSVKGVTPELVGGLFAAAAAFYRAAPWVELIDEHTFAITVPPEDKPRFAKVMGNAGMEYGLTMYRRWEDVERMYQLADNPLEILPEDGGNSIFFEKINKIPFDDYEVIEEYGWEVAAADAYPIPIVFTRDGGAERPHRADLSWYEAALWALLIFFEKHLQSAGPDEFHPAEADIVVNTHAGQVTVHIKYPGGTISKELRPVDMMDFPELDEDDEEDLFIPDRRAMEGAMAQFAANIEGPDVNKAQALMYQAWEESDPAQRIILAHEALAISPDCADAYVLLAEEEADTKARALEYYRKGVEAGERALGQDYFEENEGYFWGLLETRPYMRARQGLANLLWETGRKDEAIAHYQDILRLNPGDNQGIRYTLLNVLVGLKRDAEAQALLEEYEDDAMAEWLYTRALLTFQAEGASEAAVRSLKEALEQNPHVPAYLTGRKRIPNRRPAYMGWGDENEAIHYAAAYLPHWRRTHGAVAWLKSRIKPSQPARKKKSKKGKRGRGRGGKSSKKR